MVSPRYTIRTTQWYNVRNARLTVENDCNMETDVCFDDGYYHSLKALAMTLNGDKPGRVKLSYEPVTQKFIAHVKSKTKFTFVARMTSETKLTLYGDLPNILGFDAGSAAPVSRQRFVRCLYEPTPSSI